MLHFYLLLFIFSGLSFGASITESDFYKYDVFFTNPICQQYDYSEVVYSNDGTLLNSKPKNVYCKQGDKNFNLEREDSPNYNLRKLINNSDVNKIFLTYLSFSDQSVTEALCSAIEQRNLDVTIIVDSKNESRASAMAKVEKISKCRAKESALEEGELSNIPTVMTRGNIGGLGYAHNKIIIANFKSQPRKSTIVFSSGNMSSGTVLHHENWHFLTMDTSSFFYQIHQCIKEGMLNHASKKSLFKKFISQCRGAIESEPESDIQVYIVPSDGVEAMNNLTSSMEKAKSIDVAVHRLTHKSFIAGLVKHSSAKKVRLIVDDDIYWAGKLKKNIGSSMPSEAGGMNKIRIAGAQIGYMETNESSRLLHHNKFVIFNNADGTGSVHTGAGNFTHAAFSKNFENYYFIKIPKVVDIFNKQYKYMFEELASHYNKLPDRYVKP